MYNEKELMADAMQHQNTRTKKIKSSNKECHRPISITKIMLINIQNINFYWRYSWRITVKTNIFKLKQDLKLLKEEAYQ